MKAAKLAAREWIYLVLGAVGLWSMLVGLLLLEIVPSVPRTALGWIVLILAGPPLYVAAAWLVEETIGSRIQRLAPRRLSPAWFAMMGVAVAIGFGLVALTAWFAPYFDR